MSQDKPKSSKDKKKKSKKKRKNKTKAKKRKKSSDKKKTVSNKTKRTKKSVSSKNRDTSNTMTDSTPKTEQSKTKTNSGSSAMMKGFFLVVALVIIGALGAGVVYAKQAINKGSDSPYVIKAAEVLGTPVAKVNGDEIEYAAYAQQKKALTQFYKQQSGKSPMPTPGKQQISDQVLSRLVANELIKQVAAERSVEVSQEEIQNAKENIRSNVPEGQDIEKQLEERYGWTFGEYINNVVRPSLLEKNLKEQYLESAGNDKKIKQKAQQVLDEVKNGGNFAELAQEHGEDATSEKGGELGWFGKGMMVKPFEDAVFNLESGEVNDELVQTQYGYHIVKVNDKRTTTTDKGAEKEEVNASHILFKTSGDDEFAQFMDKKFKEANIEVLIDGINNPFEKPKQKAQGKTKEQMKKEIQKKIQQKMKEQQKGENSEDSSQ